MCATIFIGPSLVLHKILLPWDFSELTRINKIPTLPESYQRPKFVVKVGRGRKMSKYSNFANSEWHLCEGWNQKEHLREAGTDRNALGYRTTPNLERYEPDFWAIRNICCLCLQEMKVREPSGRSCELSAGLARLMCVCWCRQEAAEERTMTRYHGYPTGKEEACIRILGLQSNPTMFHSK